MTEFVRQRSIAEQMQDEVECEGQPIDPVIAWVVKQLDAGWSEDQVREMLESDQIEAHNDADDDPDNEDQDADGQAEADGVDEPGDGADAIDAKRKPRRGPLMELVAEDGSPLTEDDLQSDPDQLVSGWLQT